MPRKSRETKKATLSRRLRRNAKAGWRKIGTQRIYFRSKMEANYARILEARRKSGEIVYWKHEPHAFYFPGIKRGCVSYLPDFQVVTADGSVRYEECKGYMDSKSATKLKRMAKYFPAVTIVLIDPPAYKELKDVYVPIIKDWE